MSIRSGKQANYVTPMRAGQTQTLGRGEIVNLVPWCIELANQRLRLLRHRSSLQ